jgi:methanogenic corrinoid protein MtbC1
MSAPDANPFAAELLQRSCQSFAGYAASAMLAASPETARRFGPDASAGWKTHQAQRLLELAAALRVGSPGLFVARVRWMQKAFQARSQGMEDLGVSLRSLREVLAERLPPPARNGALEYLDKGIAALASEVPAPAKSELDPARPNDRIALAYLQKVLSGDVAGATDDVLRAVAGGLSASAAYLEVLLPAEREIGHRWHTAKVSVGEEHLVTYAIQRTMAILSHQSRPAAGNGKAAVVAAVAGNAHDIGLRAAAELYRLAGWHATFLGADVPPEDLVAMLGYVEADLLLLGVTLAPQLGKASETIRLVRERCERPVRIIVGGAAFDDAPDVWQTIGADAYAASLASAERLGARLIGLAA